MLALAAWLATTGLAAAASTTLPSRPKAAHHSWGFLVIGASAGLLALVLAVPPKATFSRLLERRRGPAAAPEGEQAPAAPARAVEGAETCVIRWGEGILSSHFYAEARGPRGRFVAGRSATFAFDGAEPPQRTDIVAAHDRLMGRLAKRGWRLAAESGDGPWWERRLTRGKR